MDTAQIPTGSVVVAVDGSDDADRAVTWAARHAHLTHRRLAVVHASTAPNADVAAMLDAAGDTAEAVAPDVATLKVPVRGDARIALVDASRGAELLVMGSRGRGIFRSLLGSVSAAVAKHAACPVAVVRGRDEDAEIRRVVVGADGSDGSRAVVAHAYRLGSLYRVPVLVVHCYWDVVAAAAGARELPREDPENQRLEVGLAELVAGLAEDHPDVDVQIALRHGLVDTVLTSNALPGDLIVVGRHEGSSPAHLLTGSVATAVLEQARSTVLVVPELRPTRRPAAPAP